MQFFLKSTFWVSFHFISLCVQNNVRMNHRTISYFVEIIKNLTFLYLCLAVLPPPTKLELTLAGKTKEKHGKWVEGTYILGDGLVNGYPHWLMTDGSQAIWFDKVVSNWKVGDKEDLGTKYGYIAGLKGKDSYPNEIKQGWIYYDNGAWHDAGPNDVIFKAIGTFFKFHFTKSIHSISIFTSKSSIQLFQRLLLLEFESFFISRHFLIKSK